MFCSKLVSLHMERQRRTFSRKKTNKKNINVASKLLRVHVKHGAGEECWMLGGVGVAPLCLHVHLPQGDGQKTLQTARHAGHRSHFAHLLLSKGGKAKTRSLCTFPLGPVLIHPGSKVQARWSFRHCRNNNIQQHYV